MKMDYANLAPLEKLPTGIEGVEDVTIGGLPKGRTTLVVGSAGAGKTIFAAEFIYRSIAEFGRRGIFVTFEERVEDVIRNVKRFQWPLDEYAKDGRLTFIDSSRDPLIVGESGDYELGGLMAQIRHAVRADDTVVLVLDSVGALLSQFKNEAAVRRGLLEIIDLLRDLGVTAVLTAERSLEYGPISKLGVEEFVSDNVIVLRNVLMDERCRRTLQVLKVRGDGHFKGEYPFTITRSGISILPLATMELEQVSTSRRISTGNAVVDRMMNGGLFGDAIALVSGPTGSGKTLMCTMFANEACARSQERLLYLAFEESRAQLRRNALSWGVDFEALERAGLLRVVCRVPESLGAEEHLLSIRREIESFRPQRLVVDSVSAIARSESERSFREFIIGLATYARANQVATLLTSTTPRLSGGDSITEAHISTLTDAIILLRYVEIRGSLRRGIAVIKMRGSQHEKEIREFEIGSNGLIVGQPLENVQNVILGVPQRIEPAEYSQLKDLFTEEP